MERKSTLRIICLPSLHLLTYATKNVFESVTEYQNAPNDKKPTCRPWLVLTLSHLVSQTATAIAGFSTLLDVVTLQSDWSITKKSNLRVVKSIENTDPLWAKRNQKNLRTVVVISYHTFASQFGPHAQTSWKREQDKSYAPREKRQPDQDTSFPGSPQYGLRNVSTFYTSVLWADAPQVWLFSGSPAPRGLVGHG